MLIAERTHGTVTHSVPSTVAGGSLSTESGEMGCGVDMENLYS